MLNNPVNALDADGHSCGVNNAFCNLFEDNTTDQNTRNTGNSNTNAEKQSQQPAQKKAFELPKDPEDVGKNPNWKPDPKFDPKGRTRPGTRQWVDGDGNRLRFDPKDPSKSPRTEGGKDHYHYNDSDKHLQPGDDVPDPAPHPSPQPSDGGGGNAGSTSGGPNQQQMQNAVTATEVLGTVAIIVYWLASQLN